MIGTPTPVPGFAMKTTTVIPPGDVLATHERILVDVADTVTWSQFTAGSNFIFN